ncbi:Adenylate cyclase [Vibrio marisflavi CECT 7928]|uniref:Adenylate cyclase n=1 Tax=Vibrio marisflavi CECT 7928 TaxID=634439 RepID=A0ABM9A8S2_9VIBR|nr:Adenylate cyclase [Vibrio marisflavi CECT 7928]
MRLIQIRYSRLDRLNQQRIDRALALMSLPSQRVFNLIPALFHYHLPSIPGHFDDYVPSGVFSFQPSEEQLNLLVELGLEVSIDTELASTSSDILALYTMGSTSSIGQSTSSDLDVWFAFLQTWTVRIEIV